MVIMLSPPIAPSTMAVGSRFGVMARGRDQKRIMSSSLSSTGLFLQTIEYSKLSNGSLLFIRRVSFSVAARMKAEAEWPWFMALWCFWATTEIWIRCFFSPCAISMVQPAPALSRVLIGLLLPVFHNLSSWRRNLLNSHFRRPRHNNRIWSVFH